MCFYLSRLGGGDPLLPGYYGCASSRGYAESAGRIVLDGLAAIRASKHLRAAYTEESDNAYVDLPSVYWIATY